MLYSSKFFSCLHARTLFQPSTYSSNKRREERTLELQEECLELAKIIGGFGFIYNGICVLLRPRKYKPYILGRRTRSPIAATFTLTLEAGKKTSLNLGEAFVFQHEAKPLMNALKKRGLIVTDAQSKWLYDYPKAQYIHWETVGDKTEFTKNSIAAAREAGLY